MTLPRRWTLLVPGRPAVARAVLRAAALAGVLALAACATGPAPPVPAGWERLAPGLLQRRPAPGVRLLRLDLREPARRLALSAPAERGQAIDAMPSARAALVAVNASFFDRGFRVRGLTVSTGQAWPDPIAPQASPLLACDAEQNCTMQLAPPYALPDGTLTAVAGTPWLVRGGRARSADDDAACAAFCAQAHPRTAIGLDATQRHLLVLVAEGRRAGLPGLALAEVARLLQAHGAHEALNLDGGGSTALLIDGRAAIARPDNEPAQRPIANALLIR